MEEEHIDESQAQISEGEREEWSMMFKELDEDGSGFLEKQEIRDLMFLIKRNPTDADIDLCFNSIDRNSDEKVDFDEFCRMMATLSSDPETEMKESIQSCLDKNGDGFIDRAELEELLQQDGSLDSHDHDLLELLDTADVDKSGKIPVDTFINLIQNPAA